MLYKIRYVLPFALLFCAPLYAQKLLSGKVLNNQQAPVPYASINLLNAADSSVIQGALTDSTGRFSMTLKATTAKGYRLRVQAVGYQPYRSIDMEVPSQSLTLEPIVLNESGALQTVTVTSRKPFVEKTIDRMIVNPDALIGNAGITALELLARSPGVQTDANDNISLRGKGGVMIFIDDKPTYMPAAELSNYLSSIPASSIASIEIMTTPPARYDAAGNAGVINIKLKKTTVKGLNGGFSLSYGQGVYHRTNNSVNANYRFNKVNVYGNIGYNDINSFQDLVIERRYLAPETQTLRSVFRQNSLIKIERGGLNGRFGVDYYATKNTVYSVVTSGFLNPNVKKIVNGATLKNNVGALESRVDATNTDQRSWHNGSAGFNVAHNIGKDGKKLSGSLDYLYYGANNGSDLRNQVFLPSGQLQLADNLVGRFPASILIKTAKTDYEQPFKKGQLAIGAKTSFINTDNTANFFDRQPNGTETINLDLTNRFQYRENINAVYANFNRSWGRFELQSGLRAENTQIKGYQFGNARVADSSFARTYTNLFPTLYGSYNLDSAGVHQLGMSYGYRIQRPDYQSLNPFAFPLDKFTIYAGNPFLRPVFTHNVELSHTYKNMLTTTLTFSYTQDDIRETIENSTVFISRPGNVGRNWINGISMDAGWTLRKWWIVNAHGDLNYIRTTGELYGQSFNTAAVFGNFSGTFQFIISPLWSAELNGFYRSRLTSGQFSTYPMGQINCGAQRKILKNKGSLKLNINDMFYIFRPGGDLSALANSTALYYSRLDTRVATLTFSYRFNQGQIRQARQNDGSESERKRVSAG
jgi:iron complex outermembrane recepter protein